MIEGKGSSSRPLALALLELPSPLERLVCGMRCVVCGAWCVVCGVCVVCGMWRNVPARHALCWHAV